MTPSFRSQLNLIKSSAAFFMISVHGVMWLVYNYQVTDFGQIGPLVQFVLMWGMYSMGIPAAAGFALAQGLHKYEVDGRLHQVPVKPILTFCLIIAGLETLKGILTFGLAHVFVFNALHLIAVSFLLIYFLHRYSIYLLMASIPLFLLIYVQFSQLEGLSGILFGNDQQFWPIMAWTPTVVFGYLLGKSFLHMEEHPKRNLWLWSWGLLGLLMTSLFFKHMSFYFFAHLKPQDLFYTTLQRPNIWLLIGVMGFFVHSCLLAYALRFKMRPKDPYNVVNTFSKHILAVYLFHFIVGWPISRFVAQHLSLDWGMAVFPLGLVLLCYGFLCALVFLEKGFSLTIGRQGLKLRKTSL